jgi:hypothetical protein
VAGFSILRIHDADHGDLDEGEVGSDAVFDVFGEASAAVEPSEGAFDEPALRQHDEALGGVRSLDDLQRRAGGLVDGAGRVGALIAAIGDDALQKREQPSDGSVAKIMMGRTSPTLDPAFRHRRRTAG